MGQRFAAKLIDIVIAVVVYIPVSLIFGGGARAGKLGPGTVLPGLILVMIWAVYEVGLTVTRGATVGKMALGLRVVREDGQPVDMGPAALRWAIQFVGIPACCIGLLVVWASPLFDGTKRYQGWHDKVAKTLVVKP
jgi:uncharacterized RDD family membrane protein YckC